MNPIIQSLPSVLLGLSLEQHFVWITSIQEKPLEPNRHNRHNCGGFRVTSYYRTRGKQQWRSHLLVIVRNYAIRVLFVLSVSSQARADRSPVQTSHAGAEGSWTDQEPQATKEGEQNSWQGHWVI